MGISKFELVDIPSVLESIIGCFLHQFSRMAATGSLELSSHFVPSPDHSYRVLTLRRLCPNGGSLAPLAFASTELRKYQLKTSPET